MQISLLPVSTFGDWQALCWSLLTVVWNVTKMNIEVENRNWQGIHIGRSLRRGFLDHVFMLHYTFFPHLLAQRGVRRAPQREGHSLVAFNVTLLILVLEIPFNFYFDIVNASFEQILFPWHTWARSKGLRTIGFEWPANASVTYHAAAVRSSYGSVVYGL